MIFFKRSRLRIDAVSVPGTRGRIGLCACPGAHRVSGTRNRGPEDDLRAIRDWGASGLVTLLETEELQLLDLSRLPELTATLGMWWRHLPIRDMGAPDENFEAAWADEGPRLKRILGDGGAFVLHCWAGLGRTGTVAARLLVEAGLPPETAIIDVREARPGSIQSMEQEFYVRRVPMGKPPAGSGPPAE